MKMEVASQWAPTCCVSSTATAASDGLKFFIMLWQISGYCSRGRIVDRIHKLKKEGALYKSL
jgi:hypothetical protein